MALFSKLPHFPHREKDNARSVIEMVGDFGGRARDGTNVIVRGVEPRGKTGRVCFDVQRQRFTGWRFTQGTPPEKVSNWMVKDGVIHLTGGGKPNLGTRNPTRTLK